MRCDKLLRIHRADASLAATLTCDQVQTWSTRPSKIMLTKGTAEW